MCATEAMKHNKIKELIQLKSSQIYYVPGTVKGSLLSEQVELIYTIFVPKFFNSFAK